MGQVQNHIIQLGNFLLNDLYCIVGLTNEFKPFILGIESSDSKINSDAIKQKLLDIDYKNEKEKTAFLGSTRRYPKFKFKCHQC